jgi:hypothetical protein
LVGKNEINFQEKISEKKKILEKYEKEIKKESSFFNN